MDRLHFLKNKKGAMELSNFLLPFPTICFINTMLTAISYSIGFDIKVKPKYLYMIAGEFYLQYWFLHFPRHQRALKNFSGLQLCRIFFRSTCFSRRNPRLATCCLLACLPATRSKSSLSKERRRGGGGGVGLGAGWGYIDGDIP